MVVSQWRGHFGALTELQKRLKSLKCYFPCTPHFLFSLFQLHQHIGPKTFSMPAFCYPFSGSVLRHQSSPSGCMTGNLHWSDLFFSIRQCIKLSPVWIPNPTATAEKRNILRALEQWTLIWNSWSCGQLSLTAAHVAFLNNFHRCIWNQKRFSMFSAPWSPGHFHLVHYKKVKVRGLGSSIKKCNFQPVEVVPWTCRDNYRNSWRDWEMDFPVSAH